MNTSATYAILPMIYTNLTLHKLLSCCFKCIWYLPNGAEHNCQYNLIYQIDVLFGPFGTHQLNPFASFNPFDNAVITKYLQFSLLLAHTTPIADRCLLWLHFMLTHIRINVDVVVESILRPISSLGSGVCIFMPQRMAEKSSTCLCLEFWCWQSTCNRSSSFFYVRCEWRGERAGGRVYRT